MSRAVTVASKQQKRIVRNMANDFRRLDCISRLGTGRFAWAWFEFESDDFDGRITMLKLRMILTLPEQGFSELIFVDRNRDDEPS